MRSLLLLLGFWAMFPALLMAQQEDVGELPMKEGVRPYKLKSQRYKYTKPEVDHGDTIWCYLLPEIVKYKPMAFKSEAQRRKFNRLVYNVKKVLPLAQEARSLIEETYEVLEQLPNSKAREAHMRTVEKEIKERYTPEMKKLTYSQGKLLIKLIDRECNQTSYEILQAFVGPAKASFYQVFAWTFRASLKKEYAPEGDDRLVERIVTELETGAL